MDLVREGVDGRVSHDFIQFIQGKGKVKGVKTVPLGKVPDAGMFIVASVDGKNHMGVCRRSSEGWKCHSRIAESLKSPVVFAEFLDVGSRRSLFIIASDGAAYEVVMDSSLEEIKLKPAGWYSWSIKRRGY